MNAVAENVEEGKSELRVEVRREVRKREQHSIQFYGSCSIHLSLLFTLFCCSHSVAMLDYLSFRLLHSCVHFDDNKSCTKTATCVCFPVSTAEVSSARK